MNDLCNAARTGHVEAVLAAAAQQSALVDARDAQHHDRTALFVAAMHGHAHVVEALVGLGSKALDVPDQFGVTPLGAATKHPHVVETLVRLGARALDTPDKNGWTPLCIAAQNGHADTIAALVRLGSTALDRPDNEDWTPMHIAACSGHVHVVETLHRLGSAALDLPDSNGWTPLFVAARHGHDAVVAALLRLGCTTLDWPDHDGRTPLGVAVQMGHMAAAELLAAAGVSVPASLLTVRLPAAMQPLRSISEHRARELRYRLYFSQTLLALLLLERHGPVAPVRRADHDCPVRPLISTSVVDGHMAFGLYFYN